MACSPQPISGRKRQTRTPAATRQAQRLTECAADDDEDDSYADGGGSLSINSVRDVKNKVSDFSRFVDGIAAENENNKKELAASQKRVISLTEKHTAFVAELVERTQVEERLHIVIGDQEASIQVLRTANADLQKRVDNFADESDELFTLRSAVANVKSQLKDYITLDSTGSSLLTTSGQVWQFCDCLCESRY
jgi:hypothetical protein